jgi:TIGR03009 family protein
MPLRGIIGTAVMASGLLGLWPALAQERNSTKRLPEQKLVRPAAEVLRVTPPTPELLKLLKEWEESSKNIKRLDGEHTRWEFDCVFNVVTRSYGEFYYQTPDKGRIDLLQDTKLLANKGAPTTMDYKHWKTGQRLVFKLQSGNAEKWYCDGEVIIQIDEAAKTATKIIIPKENQGVNITDGPLPFLFGMPAEKAIRRYQLQILEQTDGKATLQALPLWRSDAANYRLATIKLDLKTYLPDAVQLIDPAGTKETVFKFKNLQINPQKLGEKWLKQDPFKPNLKGLKVVNQVPIDENAQQANGVGPDKRVQPVHGTPSATKAVSEAMAKAKPKSERVPEGTIKSQGSAKSQPIVPSVIGLEWTKARDILKHLGYEVSLQRGSVADDEAQISHVERQQPDAKAAHPVGQKVTLWLYMPESDAPAKK